MVDSEAVDASVFGQPKVMAGEDLEQGDLVYIRDGKAFRAVPGSDTVARHAAKAGEPLVVLRVPKKTGGSTTLLGFPVVPVDDLDRGNILN